MMACQTATLPARAAAGQAARVAQGAGDGLSDFRGAPAVAVRIAAGAAGTEAPMPAPARLDIGVWEHYMNK